jgi:hypothetical protein
MNCLAKTGNTNNIVSLLLVRGERKISSNNKKGISMSKSPFTNNPFVDLPRQSPAALVIEGIFNIRFTRFMTNVLIPVIWSIVLVTSFLDYVYTIMTAFGMPPSQALEVLLFTPARFFLSALAVKHPIAAIFLSTILLCISLVVTRITLEIIIVFFRIEAHLRAMREKSEQ